MLLAKKFAMIRNYRDYQRAFEVNRSGSSKLLAAFAQVSDIRKFEIELYWKRAGYFWALIAVTFAGYFAMVSIEVAGEPVQFLLSGVAAATGLVFTFAWYLANRGSKFWQENWENHLDLLEDGVTGPLYKTILERPELEDAYEKFVTGPLPLSVSRVNQRISIYVVFVWLFLAAFSVCMTVTSSVDNVEKVLVASHAVVMLMAIAVCCLMWRKSRTYRGDHHPMSHQRKVCVTDSYHAETLEQQRQYIR
jgi:Flp pilus assembly protein TadB